MIGRCDVVPGNQKGSGLVLAILIIVALFVLGSSLAFLTRTDVNISKHQTQSIEALYVAEAGVEEAVERLALTYPTDITVNGSTFNAAIRDTVVPFNPNWHARIFLCRPGLAPAAGENEYHTATVQSASDWLTYSSASDPDLAVNIEHKWVDRNGDGTRQANEIVRYDASKIPPQNFTTGDVVETITVTGEKATARRQVRAEVTRYPLNVNAKAALLSDGPVDLKGNVGVCGHNHDLLTEVYSDIPSDCRDYVACTHQNNSTTCVPAGCLCGTMTTGDIIDSGHSTNLFGSPATNTDSTNTFYTLAQTLGITQAEVDEILAQADWHSANDADPLDGITYIDGDASDAEKFNNVDGSGLLYVTGDLEITGNFTWKGLIYVEGDLGIKGTAWILGAIVVKGDTYAEAVNFGAGTPTVLYSSDALDFYLKQNLKYVKIAWKETGGL
jgi:hypothetical protein